MSWACSHRRTVEQVEQAAALGAFSQLGADAGDAFVPDDLIKPEAAMMNQTHSLFAGLIRCNRCGHKLTWAARVECLSSFRLRAAARHHDGNPITGSRERPLLCGREPASSRTADERGLRDLGGGQSCVGLQCVGAVLGLAC